MVASFESFVVIVRFDIIVLVRLAPGGIADEATVTSVAEGDAAFDGVLDTVLSLVVLFDKTVALVEAGATVGFTVLPVVEELLTFAVVKEMIDVAVDELLIGPVVLSVVLVSLTTGPIDTVVELVLSIVLDGATVELTSFTIDEGLLAVTSLVDGGKEMELEELPFVGPVELFTSVVESAGSEKLVEMVRFELDPMEFVLAAVCVVVLTFVEEPRITEETGLLEL